MTQHSSSSNEKRTPFKSLFNVVFGLGVLFGHGLQIGINKGISVIEQKETRSKVELQHVNRVDYEQLKLGMSLTDVQAILGRGIEINRTETTATFLWQNFDDSHITIKFKNGKLVSKAQSNLK
ncbi:hypothetical protein [Calothrix rhizosoleniae]|uniref:hypothetical protein n=1 Tax=Calothrix rhizosoleniae TaxID=888997 RepID=UPI000B4A4F91|nr:hypothetical protein [Calothrix rhizosoleniae]